MKDNEAKDLMGCCGLIVGCVASTSQKHQAGVSAVNWANNIRGVVSGTAV